VFGRSDALGHTTQIAIGVESPARRGGGKSSLSLCGPDRGRWTAVYAHAAVHHIPTRSGRGCKRRHLACTSYTGNAPLQVGPTHHPHGCEVSRPLPQHRGVYPSPPSLPPLSLLATPPHLGNLIKLHIRAREQQLHHLRVALFTGVEQRRGSMLRIHAQQCTPREKRQ
jgi:hypothetical protein